MKLPNADRAVVDLAKLRDYSLNPEHELGRHKARVFRSALGLTRVDAERLRSECLRIVREGDVGSVAPTPFGTSYVIDNELVANAKNAIVRTVWIVENGTDFPRLVSCYVK